MISLLLGIFWSPKVHGVRRLLFVPWRKICSIDIFLYSCYFRSSIIANTTADLSNNKEESTKFGVCLFVFKSQNLHNDLMPETRSVSDCSDPKDFFLEVILTDGL